MTADNQHQTRFRVGGMDCGSCAAKIETALGRLPGVESVEVSLSSGAVSVRHDGRAALPELTGLVASLGFTPVAAAEETHHGHAHGHGHGGGSWWRGRQGMLTLGSGLAVAAAYGIGTAFPQAGQWAFLAAVAVGLAPILRRAVAAARLGTPFSIETLMSVAALGAVLIGAEEEAAAVVFLFLVGEALEGVAAGRARSGIRALAGLLPKTARREEADGGLREVPAASLAIGDIILVRPGDRIAADGIVLSGQSGVDEAPVTGESLPKAKAADDPVHAGTINGDGALRVRVTAAAADNTIARIVRLVEQAQDGKAPTARFIDRFARLYTPAVAGLAALVAVAPPLLAGGDWAEWIYRGLAVLLIGCPCALVISTPAAIASGLSAGARRGLLIKGGAVLEALGRITQVAFDKTGTLTEGRPSVTDIRGFGLDEDEVLALAAGLSTGASHPLARAILERAAADGVTAPPATGLAALPGQGISGTVGSEAVFLGSVQAVSTRAIVPGAAAALAAEGKTVSLLLVKGRVAGLLAMRDGLRADAAQGIADLARLDVKAVMVTGDNAAAAGAVAEALRIEAHAHLLPEDKLRLVRGFQARGERVAKVGDGINDAPALAAADVGIAMGGGADVALETADAASLHGRVGDIAAMIALSRRTLDNIRQNVGIALGLKAVFLVTTVLGITGLWPAVLADTGATVLVTANALRLLRQK